MYEPYHQHIQTLSAEEINLFPVPSYRDFPDTYIHFALC